jgi:hypothetical protein
MGLYKSRGTVVITSNEEKVSTKVFQSKNFMQDAIWD